jgi:type IV pilus modification protein PilV
MRPNAGFAMLEAMVALLLFSIGILGLLSLQTRAISTESYSQDRNRAALVADRCASQMQLQANRLAMTSGADSVAATLKGLCSDVWNKYLETPEQSRLPSDTQLVVGDPVWPNPMPSAATAGGPTFVPVSFDIKVTWTTPAPSAGTPAAQPTAAAPSQFVTTTTLLIPN